MFHLVYWKNQMKQTNWSKAMKKAMMNKIKVFKN